MFFWSSSVALALVVCVDILRTKGGYRAARGLSPLSSSALSAHRNLELLQDLPTSPSFSLRQVGHTNHDDEMVGLSLSRARVSSVCYAVMTCLYPVFMDLRKKETK